MAQGGRGQTQRLRHPQYTEVPLDAAATSLFTLWLLEPPVQETLSVWRQLGVC